MTAEEKYANLLHALKMLTAASKGENAPMNEFREKLMMAYGLDNIDNEGRKTSLGELDFSKRCLQGQGPRLQEAVSEIRDLRAVILTEIGFDAKGIPWFQGDWQFLANAIRFMAMKDVGAHESKSPGWSPPAEPQRKIRMIQVKWGQLKWDEELNLNFFSAAPVNDPDMMFYLYSHTDNHREGGTEKGWIRLSRSVEECNRKYKQTNPMRSELWESLGSENEPSVEFFEDEDEDQNYKTCSCVEFPGSQCPVHPGRVFTDSFFGIDGSLT
tara:strand:- start:1370 stop:2179 length:810 start_codon:yes stop_codon:yes gene_type:complete